MAKSITAFFLTYSAELLRFSIAKSRAERGTVLGPEAKP